MEHLFVVWWNIGRLCVGDSEVVDEVVLLVEAGLEAGYTEVVEVEGDAYAAVGLQEGPGCARCLIAVDGMEHEIGAGAGLAEQEAEEFGVQ